MIGIGVKRTSGSSSTFSLNSISALLQSNERFITQDDPNPITPSFTLSRPDDGVSNPSMWVAPCAVVFAADATTDTAVTLPYHECFYYWDYGDSAQETEYWQYGARPGTQSKNHDRGPIGGHLYTEPGEYTVTLHVLDAFGNYNTASQTITVTDPDVIFAGAKTYCISADGDFTGAPVGTPPENLITSPYINIITRESDTRYLYKRGQTFTNTNATGPQFINKRNVQIGSFGDTNLPRPVLETTIASGSILYLWGNRGVIDNFQVFGLKLSNPNDDNTIVGVRIVMDSSSNSILSEYGHMTYYDIETEKLRLPSISGNGSAVVNCYGDVSGAGGAVGIWGSDVHDSMAVGNYVNNAGRAEHCCRIQGGRRIHIAHNDFRNPAANGKNCLTIRGSTSSTAGQVINPWPANTVREFGLINKPSTPNGFLYRICDMQGDRKTHVTDEPVWPTTIGETVVDNNVTWRCEYIDTTATTSNNVPAYYVSNLYNVCDNLFYTDVQTTGDGIGGSNYLTHIAHQGNSNYYELTEDIIWDGNLYYPNTNPPNGTFILLFIQSSQKVSIRNNLFNMSRPDATTCNLFGISAYTPYISGMPALDHVFIYNNSFFSSYSTTSPNYDQTAIRLPATSSPVALVAKNNLAYFPNAYDAFVISDESGEAILSNNTADLQVKSDNPFVVAAPYNADDYKLAESSYAKSAGVAVDAMFIDYYGNTRDRASFDIGAIGKDSY
jgi:hypothetical protein